jgi:hypothetical protein
MHGRYLLAVAEMALAMVSGHSFAQVLGAYLAAATLLWRSPLARVRTIDNEAAARARTGERDGHRGRLGEVEPAMLCMRNCRDSLSERA